MVSHFLSAFREEDTRFVPLWVLTEIMLVGAIRVEIRLGEIGRGFRVLSWKYGQRSKSRP